MRPVARPRGSAGAVLLVAFAVGLALVLVVGRGSDPVGAAIPSAASSAAEVTTTLATSPTTPDGGAADPGIGGLDTGSNAPSPRGEPEPPRSQRVADTAIFVGLLVVLVGGVAVALWSGRRSRSAP